MGQTCLTAGAPLHGAFLETLLCFSLVLGWALWSRDPFPGRADSEGPFHVWEPGPVHRVVGIIVIHIVPLASACLWAPTSLCTGIAESPLHRDQDGVIWR